MGLVLVRCNLEHWENVYEDKQRVGKYWIARGTTRIYSEDEWRNFVGEGRKCWDEVQLATATDKVDLEGGF